MDMDRPPYRSLYSVTLCMGATPIFSYNSVLAVPADSGPIDCALSRNTGVFHNTTPNKLSLQRYTACMPTVHNTTKIACYADNH